MNELLESSMPTHSDPSSSAALPQGARRSTTERASRADPEVVQVARRRQFSASQKRALVAEADRCKAAGTLGAFLRRERIYSSILSSWRKQLGAADQAALAPKRRGPKPDLAARQIQQLNRENERLRRRLERAELIIDAQKKLCALLGLPTSDDRSERE